MAIRDFYIIEPGVEKNSLNISGLIDHAAGLAQGDVVDLSNTQVITQPADLAGAQAAEYIIINADSGKAQYDSYVEAVTGTALKFADGTDARVFRLKSLEGDLAVAISGDIVDATAAVGNTLIPLFDGGWSVNAVVTGYAYYLKVSKIQVTEQGNVYLCTVVVA